MKAQLFEIAHTTVDDYHAPVTVSHHVMHLTSDSLSRLRRLTHEIEVEPTSAVTNRPILEAVTDLTARIHHEFKFDPTPTTVSTPLAEVLERRRGVCQDFAHLQIARRARLVCRRVR